MKAFNKFFFIAVICAGGILFQSCWKDKTVKDKGFDDIQVNISPAFGIPLVNLKIKGEDVIKRINRDSATNSFFIEYDKNDYDLCVIVYDKTNIPVVLSSSFTVFDTLVKYPLDFFGDLRKQDGWTPLVAYAMLYVDNSLAANFNLNLKKFDYEDLYGVNKPMTIAGSLPKTGHIDAATASGIPKRTLTIDSLAVNNPFDLVFKGRDATLEFEVTSANPPGNNGRLNLNPRIKIPAHIQVDSIVRRDTTSVDLEDILQYTGDDVISIEKATIYLKIINALPLDANVQVYFADKDYRILDSIRNEDIFVAAGKMILSNYLVQTPTTAEEEISMTKEKLKKLQSTKFLIIREKFTSDNYENVKLFKSNYMDVILSIKVDTKINGTISEIIDDISNYNK